jgi:hypothetical protein
MLQKNGLNNARRKRRCLLMYNAVIYDKKSHNTEI